MRGNHKDKVVNNYLRGRSAWSYKAGLRYWIKDNKHVLNKKVRQYGKSLSNGAEYKKLDRVGYLI